jgi:hypothetical protein
MDKDLQEFVALLDAVEKAGINSVRKLKMFIKFGSNQGKSMSELAGRAKTPEYTEVQQAVIELSVGRYNALMSPKLVVLGSQKTAKPGYGRRKPIKLSARGQRLYDRVAGFCKKR